MVPDEPRTSHCDTTLQHFLTPILTTIHTSYHQSDAFIPSSTSRHFTFVLINVCSSAFADVKFSPLSPTSLNATGLGGKLTGLGYLGSLLELNSTRSLHICHYKQSSALWLLPSQANPQRPTRK